MFTVGSYIAKMAVAAAKPVRIVTLFLVLAYLVI